MIEVKTSELIGPALRYAVAVADGWDFSKEFDRVTFNGFYPDTDWAQGGPLIAEHGKRIGLELRIAENSASYLQGGMRIGYTANTVLVASMRAIVAAHLGDTVQIPDELAERAGQ